MNNEYNNYEYQVEGSLPIDARTYVWRQADDDLYQALKQRHYCYVINSRQMGKSSLGVRTWKRLKNDGIACAFIDVTGFGGTEDTTREQWYKGFINDLLSAFQLWKEFDLEIWWQERTWLPPAKRLSKFIQEILLKKINQPIVIFIDEIDSILGLNFTLDDFFALIRYFYNQRVINPEFERLTFVLLGTNTPSDWIKDPTKTSFNIGIKIELQGFKLSKIEPLMEGLQEKADNPKAVMQEILWWTGGQPFLTHKLSQFVSQLNFRITAGNEKEQIENLVLSRIINEWKSQDHPVHLQTIQERLLVDKSYQITLLENYKKVLVEEEVNINAIEAEIFLRLRLSGLVVKQQDKVKVYNEIYKKVFNFDWIEHQLKNIRPYAQSMKAWKASDYKNNSKLLKWKDLKKAQEWAKDKILSDEDRKYLNASEKFIYNRSIRDLKWLVLGILVLLLIGALGSGIGFSANYYCLIENELIDKTQENCFRFLITSGEKNPWISNNNFDLNKATDYFNQAKDNEEYKQAQRYLNQAIIADPTDPVPYIFKSNIEARLKHIDNAKNKPLKLAVVVPIDYYEERAKALLKGIAEEQYRFNQKNKARLLEIVIINEGNEEKKTENIARELVNQKDILGIVGHFTSEMTEAALPIYEKNQIAIISVASTSSKLNNISTKEQNQPVFYRIPSSTEKAALKYVEYIKEKLSLNKVVIFYDPNSIYSESITIDFINKFANTNLKQLTSSTKLPPNVKLVCLDTPHKSGSPCKNSKSDFLDIDSEIQSVAQQQLKAVLLFSSGETNSRAIAIARKITEKNNNLLPTQQIQLFGSLALAENSTLIKGGTAVEGMIFVNPCLDEEFKFEISPEWNSKDDSKNDSKEKDKLKYDSTNKDWRVQTSYQATKLFTEAINLIKLKEEVKREDILDILNKLEELRNKEDLNDSNPNKTYCFSKIKNNKFEEFKP